MLIPEFLLCEDPVNLDLHPFIYHYETKTFLRAIHKDEQDSLPEADLLEIMEQPNYQLQYGYEIIYIIAIDINIINIDFAGITRKAALWYADYLKWEDTK
jgi:hypothetical protein